MVDVWESVLYSVARLLKLYQKLEFMVSQLIIANLSTTNRGVNKPKVRQTVEYDSLAHLRQRFN